MAYRKDDLVTIQYGASMEVQQNKHLGYHDEWAIGFPALVGVVPTEHKIVQFTYACPGERLWWSLLDVAKTMRYLRDTRGEDVPSAVVYDRWPTWQRLLEYLGLPDAFRHPAPKDSRREACVYTACTLAPICTFAGLLVILLRDAYGLRCSARETPRDYELHAQAVLTSFCRPWPWQTPL